MPGSFFDTNVLLSLVLNDAARAQRVKELLAVGGNISVQVLNEAANVLRRKRRLSWPQIGTFLSTLRDLLQVRPLDIATHDTGLALVQRFGFSIYDGMIVAAALNAGCEVLWSEDMHDGLLIDKRLRITNPFKAISAT